MNLIKAEDSGEQPVRRAVQVTGDGQVTVEEVPDTAGGEDVATTTPPCDMMRSVISETPCWFQFR